MDDRLNLTSVVTEMLFRINGLANELYSEDKYDCWCLVDLHIKNHFFCFDKTDDELLTLGEVIYLRDRLNNLLYDKMDEICLIEFFEPDLSFEFHPKLDLRTVKNLWVLDGRVIQDAYANLIINITCGGPTHNGESYRFPLFRENLESMKDYLDRVIAKLEPQWDSISRQ